MRRLLHAPPALLAAICICFCSCVSVVAGAPRLCAEVTVTPGELSISNRISYLLDDGRHPFVDDDARRALLGVNIDCEAPGTLLGFDGLVIEAVRSDAGETLLTSLPQTMGMVSSAHTAGKGHPHPRAGLSFTIGLPLPAKPYGGLSLVRGHFDLVSVSGSPVRWTMRLAQLLQDRQAHQIADQPALSLASLASAEPGHLTLVLSAQARWAVTAIDMLGADGASLKIRSPRVEHRFPPHQLPGVDRIDTMTWTAVLPAQAQLAVTYYPHLERQAVPFSLSAVSFGMQLPSASALLHGQPRGANDF
jgi:hypothetical protein